MRTRALFLVAVLGAASGCGTGRALLQADGPPPLRATGIGPVAFGTSLAETELLVGEKSVGQDTGAACRYVEFQSLPGLRFTVDNGVVTRADAAPGVPNVLGVQIGDTTESVVSLYPQAQLLAIGSAFGGSHLMIASRDGHHAIVMQATGNKVIAIWAGLRAAVDSSQGCP